MSEKQIEKSILEFLQIKGIFCWKQNTMGVYDAVKGVYRAPVSPFIIKGIADIIGCFKSRLLAVEVKTPERKNNLTEHQIEFLKNVNEAGGIGFVATSIEDVAKKLELSRRL